MPIQKILYYHKGGFPIVGVTAPLRALFTSLVPSPVSGKIRSFLVSFFFFFLRTNSRSNIRLGFVVRRNHHPRRNNTHGRERRDETNSVRTRPSHITRTKKGSKDPVICALSRLLWCIYRIAVGRFYSILPIR